MALPITYARRKRLREEAGRAKVFRTKLFGEKLLTQLYQCITGMDVFFDHRNSIVGETVVFLREEIGVLALSNARDVTGEFQSYWFNEPPNTSDSDHDMRLSALEFACQTALAKAAELDKQRVYRRNFNERTLTPSISNIIDVINARMMEDSFGFQFQDEQVIDVTSQFAHEEIIEPALDILAGEHFAAANDEFRDAFEEFKQRKYDDCIADCGNAFESVIKVIAAQKGWKDVSENDPAAKLIDALYRNELIPTWMGEQMKGLKSMLQGVATVRNKEGSHGAGEAPREVSRHLAAYQLHQTAAAIVFLAEQAEL